MVKTNLECMNNKNSYYALSIDSNAKLKKKCSSQLD